MGLPLYIAPVESDLRNKHASSRDPLSSAAAHGRYGIRRPRRRRSTEALRESRRRAILTAAAAYGPNNQGGGSSERGGLPPPPGMFRHRGDLEQGEEAGDRILARLSPPAISRESLGSVPNPTRERLLERFLERIREHEQDQVDRQRLRRTDSDGGTENNNNNARNNDSRAAPAAAAAAAALPGWRGALVSPMMSGSGDSAGNTPPAPLVPPPAPHPRPRSLLQETIREHTSRRSAVDHNNYAYEESEANRLLALFSQHWATTSSNSPSPAPPSSSPRRDYHISQLAAGRGDEADVHFSLDDAEGFIDDDAFGGMDTESDGDADDDRVGATEPLRSGHPNRRASSLRRVTNASGTSSRRPTVGWSDSHDRNRSGSRSRSRASSQSASRIFGNISHIRGAEVVNGSGSSNTARRHGWTVRYTSNNGSNRHPTTGGGNSSQNLPSIRDLFGPPPPAAVVDGLGDRRRSLSPEGDGVWDTLQTTVTPDPQPPSLGSSFASSSTALATAATAAAPVTVTQTPVLPLHEAAGAAHDEDEEDDDTITPAPLLVQTTTNTSSSSGDALLAASSSGVSSGTTSASTSQRVRSPFTVVSVDTADTADDSTVLPRETGLGEDAGCEDSEMDDDGGRLGDDVRDEDEVDDEDDEGDEDEDEDDEEAQTAAFLGLSTRRRGPSSTSSSVAAHRLPAYLPQSSSDLLAQLQRQWSAEHGGGHSGLTGAAQEQERGQRGSTTPATPDDSTLELLGIGGMQNIVRSLARREDIPDEWWAEAGLSRTLPPRGE